MKSGEMLFYALGGAAACARALTLPLRRARARAFARARAAPPVFFYEPYGMGDCIALQPLVRRWLESGRRVIAAVKPQWADVFAPHPSLTLIGVSPRYASQSGGRRRAAFFADVAHVRKAVGAAARGAEGVDVRGDVRGLLVMYALGCGAVRTLPRYHTANDWRVFPLAARREKLLPGVSRRMVNSVFAPPGAEALPMPDLSHLFPRGGVRAEPRRVGLIPCASWIGKMWAAENWRELGRILRAANFEPVFLTGPGETAPGGAPHHTADDLRAWVDLIGGCGAVVAVDTGPMHVADALGKPLVALAGSSRLPLWGPENPRAAVVHHQSVAGCAPCHQTGSAARCGARCMALITPCEVADALFSRHR